LGHIALETVDTDYLDTIDDSSTGSYNIKVVNNTTISLDVLLKNGGKSTLIITGLKQESQTANDTAMFKL
jgi:hypothetical protein